MEKKTLGAFIAQLRKEKSLTQKQLADKLDVDERTISSIEKYQANTTMEILYPLIRELKIDAREIFSPELGRESKMHYQLRLLLDGCSDEEAAILLSVCSTVLSALRNRDAIKIE